MMFVRVSRFSLLPVLFVLLFLSAGAAPAHALTSVFSCGTPLNTAGETYVLANDISSSGTCLVVGNNGITINGNGHRITYSQVNPGYAVDNSAGYDNLLITGLDLFESNATLNYAHAIYASGMQNSVIRNNTIRTGGDFDYGIYLLGSSSNTILNNSVTTDGDTAHGIYLSSSSSSNSIMNNTVLTTDYSGDGVRISSSNLNNITGNTITTTRPYAEGVNILYSDSSTVSGNKITAGLEVGLKLSSSSFSIISKNTISASGSSDHGISLYNYSSSNSLSDNNITTTGYYSNGISLSVYSSLNNMTGNNITTLGLESSGISLYASSNSNTVSGNTITTSGDKSHGIFLQIVQNSVITGNAMNTTNGYGLYIEPSSSAIYYNHVIDATNTEQGKPIYYYLSKASPFTIENLNDVGQLYLVNSADILIKNVSVVKDGIILALSTNTRILNTTVSTTGRYVYGAFLQYSTKTNITETIMDTSSAYAVYIVPTTLPQYYDNYIDIQSTEKSKPVYYYFNKTSLVVENLYDVGQIIVANSTNITLRNITIVNKDGITIAGSVNVSVVSSNISTSSQAGVEGISVLSSANVFVSGNILNTSGTYGNGIRVESSSSVVVSNNNVTTYGTYGRGIYVYSSSGPNTISYNNVTTFDSSGIYLYSSSGTAVSNNNVRTLSASASGIYLGWSDLNTIFQNSVVATNSNGYGISLEYGSDSNTVSYNNVTTLGSSGRGIYSYSNANNAMSYNNVTTSNSWGYGFELYSVGSHSVTGNTIRTSGGTSRGMWVYSSDGNTISGNDIATVQADSEGIYLYTSDSNNVTGNMISTSGANSDGIMLYSGSISNTLSGNRITAVGSGTDGIIIYSSPSNTVSDNNVTASGNGYGLYLYYSGSSNIFGGSIVSLSGRDYFVRGSDATSNITNPNFSASRSIFFYDPVDSFNYRHNGSGNLWLVTNISAVQNTISRIISRWDTKAVQWNDTNSSAGVIARYVLSGLLKNTVYSVFNSSRGIRDNPYILPSGSEGRLNFSLILGGNTEVAVMNLPIITILSPLNTTYYSSDTWFNVTLDRIGAWCGYSLDGAANVSMANSSGNWNAFSSAVSGGVHTAVFSCNDTDGLMNAKQVIFTVNLTSPCPFGICWDPASGYFSFINMDNRTLKIPLGGTGKIYFLAENTGSFSMRIPVHIDGTSKIRNWVWFMGHRQDFERTEMNITLLPREKRIISVDVLGLMPGTYTVFAGPDADYTKKYLEVPVVVFQKRNGRFSTTPDISGIAFVLVVLIAVAGYSRKIA